jgi:hypothetical protein
MFSIVVIVVLLYLNLAAILENTCFLSTYSSPMNMGKATFNRIGEVGLTVLFSLSYFFLFAAPICGCKMVSSTKILVNYKEKQNVSLCG